MSYRPEDYQNNGKPFVVGFAADSANCHMYDGDQFKIASTGVGSPYKLTYDPIVTKHVNPALATNCVDFWNTVALNYGAATGIFTGTGTNQIGGGAGYRGVSVALDRSHMNPFVVHVYVAPRQIAGPPPDDGSATGTGKR